MTNQCSTCNHPRIRSIELALRTNRSARGIAKEHGVSYESMKNHLRKGHSLSRPAAGDRTPTQRGLPTTVQRRRVWEFSDAEVAFYDRVDEEAAALISVLTGVPAETISDCMKDEGQHPADCHGHAALEANEDVWDLVASRIEKRDGKPAQGH